jgi:signal transduction histidine kinase
MDYFTKYKRQLAIRSFFLILVPILIGIFTWYLAQEAFEFSVTLSYAIVLFMCSFSAYLTTVILVGIAAEPLEMMQNIIGYAAHNNRSDQQPIINELKIGRELVTAQSLIVYDLASSVKAIQPVSSDSEQLTSQQPSSIQTLLDNIATPLFGINNREIVTFVNKAGTEYISRTSAEIINKPFYDSLNLSFQTDNTLRKWLDGVKNNSVTATKSWDRVRHVIDDDHSKQFDLVASFSSGNQSGTESVLALFDKTEAYNNDDQDVSFVALAVHELRTPLTVMKGYIEVFEDELGPTLSPELKDFMHKMHASAQRLSAFVTNILNVARIEENQLSLKLRKEDWIEILNAAVEDLELRAQVHGKHIELIIASGIPSVAVDRVSIHEVINNLVDNAIKYGGESNKIVISTQLNSDGLVETNVQDFGIGIPETIMSRLFQKYHRSHRSSAEVGGTGLGLYLSKALVKAHGGNIWVRSKEGEGSVFTFTIVPYDNISSEQQEGDDGIIRGAHGWIKNHSLYRN